MMSEINVYVVGSVGVPANYGGFETLVENLLKYKKVNCLKYNVFCSSKVYSNKLESIDGAKLIYLPLKANGAQSVLYDILGMIISARKADIILILGISGCLFLPILRFFTNAKIITNIDGLEHKREKWGRFSKNYLKLSEKVAVKNSDIVIADNKAIADYVLSEYGVNAAVIAYGGDHVKRLSLKNEIADKYGISGKYAFKVCRIEPENNIDMILEAFSKAKSIPLFIVGNWNASGYGQELFFRYASCEYIKMLDPIYDSSILNQFRSNCYIYVHGHSAGGTNPSLVEAMNLTLPILCYDVIYNRETTKNSAVYFKTSQELCSMIQNLDSIKVENLAILMHSIGKQEYSWDRIVSLYEDLY